VKRFIVHMLTLCALLTPFVGSAQPMTFAEHCTVLAAELAAWKATHDNRTAQLKSLEIQVSEHLHSLTQQLNQAQSASQKLLGQKQALEVRLADLENQRKRLADKRNQILQTLEGLEQSLEGRRASLPEPLAAQLLPPLAGQNEHNLPARVQRLQNSFQLCANFAQKQPVVHHTTLGGPDGALRDTTIVYLGLDVAFAIQEQNAAVGTPSANGWNWNWNHSWTENFRKASNIIAGSVRPSLLTLPIPTANGGQR